MIHSSEPIQSLPPVVRRARRVALLAGIIIGAGSIVATILLANGEWPRGRYWLGIAFGSLLLPAACLASYERRPTQPQGSDDAPRDWIRFGSSAYWTHTVTRLKAGAEDIADSMWIGVTYPKVARRMIRWTMVYFFASLAVAMVTHRLVSTYLGPASFRRGFILGMFLPMMVMFVPVGLISRLRMNRLARRALDNEFRMCEHCTYDLRGLPHRHTCPECGHEYDLDILRRIWREWAPVFLPLGAVEDALDPLRAKPHNTLVAYLVMMLGVLAILFFMPS